MKVLFSLLFVMLNVGTVVVAQQSGEEKIIAEFSVRGYTRSELEMIIKGGEAYLPVPETFTLLGIKFSIDSVAQRIQGFFRTSDSRYRIDVLAGNASYIDNDVLITTIDVLQREKPYLRIGFINLLFGIDIRYNPRKLIVEIRDGRDLPSIVAARRRRIIEQQQLNRKILPAPEAYIGRATDIFGSSRLDWRASSRFARSSYLDSRYSLSLGAQTFGGDLTLRLFGTNTVKRTRNELRGNIRFPFLNNPIVRQVVAGDYVTNGILPRSITGIEVTNRPPAHRIIFSRETLEGQLEPGSIVEYSGSIIGAQATKTDALGRYSVSLPFVYGRGDVTIRSFDGWGQENVRSFRVNVPRTLIPPGEFQYSISGGKTRSPQDLFNLTNTLDWGVTPSLTLGTKIDYFNLGSSQRNVFAAITATTRFTEGLVLAYAISPAAFSEASLSWLFPSNVEISLSGTHFSTSNMFNPTRRLNEVNASVIVPLIIGPSRWHFDAGTSQVLFNDLRQWQLRGGLSTLFSNFTPRLSTRIFWNDDYSGNRTTQSHLTDASVSTFLPSRIGFRAQATYNHLEHRTETIGAELTRRFSKDLSTTLSYFRVPAAESYIVGLRVEYYFPFSRVQAGASKLGDNDYQYSLVSSGSVSFDPRGQEVVFGNQSSIVGLAGFVVNPFVDANGNGVMDKGEEAIQKGRVYYSNASRGGRPIALPINHLSINRILGYEEYDVYLDPQSLENPVWVPLHSSVRVLTEPNTIKSVNISVVNGGSIRGKIIFVSEVLKPAEGITINLVRMADPDGVYNKFERTTATFSTGEYEFSGVPPGRYQIALDASQLSNLAVVGVPMSRQATVVALPDGDLVADLDFQLTVR